VTLTKNKMIQKIGQRIRLKNRDVQTMLETLIEVWTEELVNGGRIEIENFMVIDVQTIDRPANCLLPARQFRRLTVRGSKVLRSRLNTIEASCTCVK
jgi:hypothetical protein